MIAFFVITRVIPPGTTDGSVLNVALPLLAVVDLGLSFVIPRLLVQFQDQPVAGTRGALLLALAVCESVALMGLLPHFPRGDSSSSYWARAFSTRGRRFTTRTFLIGETRSDENAASTMSACSLLCVLYEPDAGLALSVRPM